MTSPRARKVRAPAPAAAPTPSIEAESRAPRTPQQSRGQKRVEEILDAAESVIAEHGLEAATTNAIAERAGASVGSLYHFFPSKDAIVQALALRFSDLMRDLNAQAMPPSAVHLPLDKLFERIVMNQVRLIEERPAFSAVYDVSCRDVLGKTAYEEMENVIIGQVVDFLSARLPRMPKKEREIIARISVTVVNNVLEDARLASPDKRPGILRELQHMMIRYFAPMDAQYGPAK
jgi:AcrR family transcriptional regulator